MNSKVVALLLALSMVLAVAVAEDEGDFALFQDFMEKRGRGRGKSQQIIQCPGNDRCYCNKNMKTGDVSKPLMCGQANAANVGI